MSQRSLNDSLSKVPYATYPMRNFRVRNIIVDTGQRNLTMQPDLSEVSLSLPSALRNVAAIRIMKVQITGDGGYVLLPEPTFTFGPTTMWLNSLSQYVLSSGLAQTGSPTLFTIGNTLVTVNGTNLFQMSNDYADYIESSNEWVAATATSMSNATLGITVDANSSIYMTLNDYPNITTASATGDVNDRPYFAWFNGAVENYPPMMENIYHDPHAYVFSPIEPRLQRLNMRFFTYDHRPLATASTRIVLQLAVYQHADT